MELVGYFPERVVFYAFRSAVLTDRSLRVLSTVKKKMCDVLSVGGGCSDVMGVQESVSLHPRPLLQDPAPFTESGSLPEERSLPNMSVLYIIFGTKVKVVL
jgi:hypothetical protein